MAITLRLNSALQQLRATQQDVRDLERQVDLLTGMVSFERERADRLADELDNSVSKEDKT